jgi:hypothetical protein
MNSAAEAGRRLCAEVWKKCITLVGAERAATLQDQGDDVVVERLDPRWRNTRRALLQLLPVKLCRLISILSRALERFLITCARETLTCTVWSS